MQREARRRDGTHVNAHATRRRALAARPVSADAIGLRRASPLHTRILAMADGEAAGGASKKGVKKAKDDAVKASTKKPDPEGLKLIEQGEAALAAKDLDAALALFKEAETKCKESKVEAAAKEKKPKAPPPEGDAKKKPEAEAEVPCDRFTSSKNGILP